MADKAATCQEGGGLGQVVSGGHPSSLTSGSPLSNLYLPLAFPYTLTPNLFATHLKDPDCDVEQTFPVGRQIPLLS